MRAKDKKKWFFAGLLCLTIWMLCGCMGSQKMSINTVLQINDQFRGQREMSAIVSDTVFRQAFNGDVEELKGFVTENCPSTLLCTAEETDKGVEIKMTLEFISLKDYTDKIGQLLGKTPGIYFDSSSSVFKDGFMIQENFSSMDLFGWLMEALKASYSQFADMDITDIFQTGATMVQFDGRTFETTEQIYVEDMDSQTFDSISVELTMNEDGSYKAALNFIVDRDTYYEMGDDMDKAIKELVPAGGVYEVTDVDAQRVYTIGFSAFNDETLISQLKSVLKTDDCRFEVTETGDESDPFRARKDIIMYLDGSYFLDFTKEETEMVYNLNVGSEYTLDGCESLTGFLKGYTLDSDSKHTSIYMTVGPSDEVHVGLTYAIDIQHFEVYTKIMNDTSYERSLSFAFDEQQAELIGENFEKRLRGRMDDDMTLDISDTSTSKNYKVTFESSSLEELSMKTTRFLDGTVDEESENYTSVITGGKSEKKRLKTRSYVYTDQIDLQRFLGSATVREDIVYRIEYPKGYTAAFDDGGHADMVEEDNVLSCTTRDSIIIVKSRGETVNGAGITQLILWWGSLVLTILSLILNIRHIAGYMRHKEKYLLKTDLFHGKNLVFMTVNVVAVVVFVFTTLRLILRIY